MQHKHKRLLNKCNERKKNCTIERNVKKNPLSRSSFFLYSVLFFIFTSSNKSCKQKKESLLAITTKAAENENKKK